MQEDTLLVESLAVVDIDPSLALFRPSCSYPSMPVRVEMGFESWAFHWTPHSPASLKNTPTCTRTLPTSQLLLKGSLSTFRPRLHLTTTSRMGSSSHAARIHRTLWTTFSLLPHVGWWTEWAIDWYRDSDNLEKEDKWRKGSACFASRI